MNLIEITDKDGNEGYITSDNITSILASAGNTKTLIDRTIDNATIRMVVEETPKEIYSRIHAVNTRRLSDDEISELSGSIFSKVMDMWMTRKKTEMEYGTTQEEMVEKIVINIQGLIRDSLDVSEGKVKEV